MSERVISEANLNAIERNLDDISRGINYVDSHIDTVHSDVNQIGNNLKVVFDEVEILTNEFRSFVGIQIRANRKSLAQTEVIKIRQELKDKYGHHDVIRRTTTGILQANDLGLIRQNTITTVTEELMITTPGYWLAPCLVALAAWINDRPELAEKAIAEAIKRDDEKTSLLFSLICRRAERKLASLKWVQRYLANQDEENLDRKAVIMLDAFASGLFGIDSEGVISKQMNEWIDKLSSVTGFVEQQRVQWSEAIGMKKQPIDGDPYPYLKRYSTTWSVINEVLEGVNLHQKMYDYFLNIFDQDDTNNNLKQQLDTILNSLVSDFDDDELPLREKEKFEQYVIDFDGDESRAKSNMNIEKTVFEERKNFTQLLTDAAMNPDSSHASVSTQKLAIALSITWILDAYNDIIAQIRVKIPNEIMINVDTFNDITRDGENEKDLLKNFNELIDKETVVALKQTELTEFDKIMLPAGGGIALVGVLFMIFNNALFGIIAIIAGVVMLVKYNSKKKELEVRRNNIMNQLKEKREKGLEVIKAILAEVVDFRIEYDRKDKDSNKVLEFLKQITPEQYLKKLNATSRKIKV